MSEENEAERVLLFNHPDVWGVGVTSVDGVLHLKVWVAQDTPEVRAFIPPVVDGLPTIIEVGGRPVPL